MDEDFPKDSSLILDLDQYNIMTNLANPNLSKSSAQASQLIRELTEYAVHKLVETASKLMTHDRTNNLELTHITQAVADMGINHFEFIPLLFKSRREDFLTPKDVIDDAMAHLSKFKQPTVHARWIVIDERIPSIEENRLVKIQHKAMEKEHQETKFNIIHDRPVNFLLPEETQLFNYLSRGLEKDHRLQVDENWDLTSLLPFLMNLLMNLGPSKNRVAVVIELARVPLLSRTMEFHIHQVLAFLLSYEGQECWEIGLEISRLVSVWQFKYPHLHRMLGTQPKPSGDFRRSYSYKIKRLAYEVYFRICPQLDVSSLERDIRNGVPEAEELLQLLRMCWLRFNYLGCEYHRFLVDGKVGLVPDEYLQSMI